jgi:hypothetical protein
VIAKQTPRSENCLRHDATVKTRRRATIIRLLLPLSALSVLVWLAFGIVNLTETWGRPWLSIISFALAAWAAWDTRHWWLRQRSEKPEQQQEK